jgi:hypothetical protein
LRVHGFFLTLFFLFSLLVHGDTFLRRGVEILPRFGDKRQVVEISQKIESDIAAYLITIPGHRFGRYSTLDGLGLPHPSCHSFSARMESEAGITAMGAHDRMQPTLA